MYLDGGEKRHEGVLIVMSAFGCSRMASSVTLRSATDGTSVQAATPQLSHL